MLLLSSGSVSYHDDNVIVHHAVIQCPPGLVVIVYKDAMIARALPLPPAPLPAYRTILSQVVVNIIYTVMINEVLP